MPRCIDCFIGSRQASKILRRLPSVRLSFPSQGLGRAESRESRERAPGRHVGLRAAARGLETDGLKQPPPPSKPLDPAGPLPVGWRLLRLPHRMIHGPGKWALLLWEPQNARPRATSVHLKSLGCSLERVGPLCLVPCEPVSLARDFLPPDSVLRVGFRHQ